jgi:hypothetical protein
MTKEMFHLDAYSILLFTILGTIFRNRFHLWLTGVLVCLLLYYGFIVRTFTFSMADYVLATGVALILLAWHLFRLLRVLREKIISWQPIVIFCLFLASYLVVALKSDTPLIWGYILVTLSFFFGLAIYRRYVSMERRKVKNEENTG